MLNLEIFESRQALSEYLYSSMNGTNTIIYASAEDVLERLGDKGQDWYRVTYRGNRQGIGKHLSAIKIDNWKDYYLHINMPQSYSADDMTNVAADVCQVNNSPQVEPVLRCTCDPTLSDDEIEVTIVVPKFDLNWHFGKMWK